MARHARMKLLMFSCIHTDTRWHPEGECTTQYDTCYAGGSTAPIMYVDIDTWMCRCVYHLLERECGRLDLLDGAGLDGVDEVAQHLENHT